MTATQAGHRAGHEPGDRAVHRTGHRADHRATGRPDGFEACYTAHHTRLVVAMFAYVGDLRQAHDIVREAFARALARWDRLSTSDDPVAWIRGVAWNLATSRWRRLRRIVRYRSGGAEHAALGATLGAALAALPAQLRRVVVMRYLADMPLAEIAAYEGVPVGAVKSWLHLGRTALTTALIDPREGNSRA